MARNTMISVRMPEDLVSKITELAERHAYLNRSLVICNILKNVTECAADADLEILASYYDAFSEGYSIQMTRKEKIFTNH